MTSPTLKDKVAIVTGAARGIGVGMALELARRGAKIAIVYTSSSSAARAEQVIDQIEALGSKAIAIQADLREIEAPEKVVAATLEAFGPKIDILVNNAGVLFNRPLLEITADDFSKIYDVNVRGALFMIKAVVPHLRAPGRIINLSSVGARDSFPNLSLYISSKAALEGITRSLASELGVSGHTVNAVLPGPTESDMLDDVPVDIVEQQKKRTPVQHRIGTQEDVGKVVAWLAEEQSAWISGQCISASGGYLMM